MATRKRKQTRKKQNKNRDSTNQGSKLPFEMVYLKKKKCYTVRRKRKDKNGYRKVYAKCSTEENANKQMRLLSAIIYNPNFKRRNTNN